MSTTEELSHESNFLRLGLPKYSVWSAVPIPPSIVAVPSGAPLAGSLLKI